ncbi:MAG: hypothetical protein VX564_05375 [Nitrospirota bacterium]|nr:hypothetical protein [Nitrospirota bacterium]
MLPILQGCPQDTTPLLKEENAELKKLAAKQESMIVTLQEGNRVMQEQVDRLNQELREEEKEQEEKLKSAQETGQGLATERHALTQQVTELTKENQKLKNDARWLRRQQKEQKEKLKSAQEAEQGLASEQHTLTQQVTELTKENQKLKNNAQWLRRQRELFRQSISMHIDGSNTQTFTIGLSMITKATKQALLQNGYSILAKMATDQNAVFVTERKTSASPSIELPGFRNQYLLVLETTGQGATTLKVKAYYEKISQDGKILGVSENEKADIELRMIRAVEEVLKGPANEGAN